MDADSLTVTADLSFLKEADKATMSSLIDQHQVRDSLKTYNALVERCFGDCVSSFYRKSLGKQEENCVVQCAEKFIKLSMRVGTRFAEVNQETLT